MVRFCKCVDVGYQALGLMVAIPAMGRFPTVQLLAHLKARLSMRASRAPASASRCSSIGVNRAM